MLLAEHHSVNAMAFMFSPHAVHWTLNLSLCSDHMLLAEHHSVNAMALVYVQTTCYWLNIIQWIQWLNFMFRPHAFGWTLFSERNGFYVQSKCFGWTSFSECNGFNVPTICYWLNIIQWPQWLLCSDHILLSEHHLVSLLHSNSVAFTSYPHNVQAKCCTCR